MNLRISSRAHKTLLSIVLIIGLVLGNTALAWASEMWIIDTSPNQGSGNNQLFGVASIDEENSSAVGSYYHTGSSYYKPLAMMLDVEQEPEWALVETPSVSGHSEFYGISNAIIPADPPGYDLWSVGYQGGDSRYNVVTEDSDEQWTASGADTLIERSTDNGASWDIVSSPNYDELSTDVLYGVSGATYDDVWAVGYYCCVGIGTLDQTLIMHWDGSEWEIVPSPNIANKYNYLFGVYAVGENDAWAVGFARGGGSYETLILHWDGEDWTQVTSPNPGGFKYLFGVTCSNPYPCWAVGTFMPNSEFYKQTLILNWDNTDWEQDTSPDHEGYVNVLYGAAAVESDYAWAVGGYDASPTQTLIERWDGEDWEIVSSPNTSSGQFNQLRGASVVPGTTEEGGGTSWAVGWSTNGSSVNQSLIMRYDIDP